MYLCLVVRANVIFWVLFKRKNFCNVITSTSLFSILFFPETSPDNSFLKLYIFSFVNFHFSGSTPDDSFIKLYILSNIIFPDQLRIIVSLNYRFLRENVSEHNNDIKLPWFLRNCKAMNNNPNGKLFNDWYI